MQKNPAHFEVFSCSERKSQQVKYAYKLQKKGNFFFFKIMFKNVLELAF